MDHKGLKAPVSATEHPLFPELCLDSLSCRTGVSAHPCSNPTALSWLLRLLSGHGRLPTWCFCLNEVSAILGPLISIYSVVSAHELSLILTGRFLNFFLFLYSLICLFTHLLIHLFTGAKRCFDYSTGPGPVG